MKKLLIAAGLAVGLTSLSAPAVAQPKHDQREMRGDRHDDRRDQRRDDHRNWRGDNGRHNGWNNNRGWHGGRHARCQIVYRHHRRVQVCNR